MSKMINLRLTQLQATSGAKDLSLKDLLTTSGVKNSQWRTSNGFWCQKLSIKSLKTTSSVKNYQSQAYNYKRHLVPKNYHWGFLQRHRVIINKDDWLRLVFAREMLRKCYVTFSEIVEQLSHHLSHSQTFLTVTASFPHELLIQASKQQLFPLKQQKVFIIRYLLSSFLTFLRLNISLHHLH